jgi:hypothetical protein
MEYNVNTMCDGGANTVHQKLTLKTSRVNHAKVDNKKISLGEDFQLIAIF